MHVVLN